MSLIRQPLPLPGWTILGFDMRTTTCLRHQTKTDQQATAADLAPNQLDLGNVPNESSKKSIPEASSSAAVVMRQSRDTMSTRAPITISIRSTAASSFLMQIFSSVHIDSYSAWIRGCLISKIHEDEIEK